MRAVIDCACTDNQIGTEGAEALAEALKANNTITAIDLSCMIVLDTVGVLIDVFCA
jgi:hypothetical protein